MPMACGAITVKPTSRQASMSEGYLIQVVPVIALGGIYWISGFEFAVIMGLAMVVGALNSP